MLGNPAQVGYTPVSNWSALGEPPPAAFHRSSYHGQSICPSCRRTRPEVTCTAQPRGTAEPHAVPDVSQPHLPAQRGWEPGGLQRAGVCCRSVPSPQLHSQGWCWPGAAWEGPGGFRDQRHLQAVITHWLPPPLIMQMREMAKPANLPGREEAASELPLCH